MFKKYFFVTLVFLLVLALPSFALSQVEYREMLKNKEFKEADKKMNDALASAKKTLSPEAFAALEDNQKMWNAFERDKDAKEWMESQNWSKTKAYAMTAEARVYDINNLAKKFDLMSKSDGPEGYYVRMEHGMQTGELYITWANDGKIYLKLDAEVMRPISEMNAHFGSFSGYAPLFGNQAQFEDEGVDEKGKIVLLFENDVVKADTHGNFNQNNGGLNVYFDGDYIRQKLTQSPNKPNKGKISISGD